MERAEGYHQIVCQLSTQLAQLQDEKAALSEQVLGLREECQAAGIRADAQAAALQAIQPLLEGAAQPSEGTSAACDLRSRLCCALRKSPMVPPALDPGVAPATA